MSEIPVSQSWVREERILETAIAPNGTIVQQVHWSEYAYNPWRCRGGMEWRPLRQLDQDDMKPKLGGDVSP